MKIKRMIYFGLSLLLLVSIIVAAVFWKSAKNEVYFLCGNFKQGTNGNSVVRQLNTASLSRYKNSPITGGSRIVFSSWVNFHFYECIVELDHNNVVTYAHFN